MEQRAPETAVEEAISYSYMFSPYILDAPDPRARLERAIRLGGGLFMAAGVFVIAVTILPGNDLYRNPTGIEVLGLVALVSGMAMLGLSRFISPPVMYLALFLVIGTITLGVYFAGLPSAGFAAMLYTWNSAISFTVLRKRWVIPPLLVMALGLAGAISTYVSGEVTIPIAVNAWVLSMGTVLVIGSIVSLLMQQVHDVAMSERESRAEAERARAELSLLNRDLEDRVRTKVIEVERLSALRRLVSANIADALLTDDKALDPHRREIAVFFIDLRGFTRFASDSDPEEVIQVLDAFYQVLGKAFGEFGATVGAFEADGVMAYFNDPTPVDNPAQRAVEMAIALREPMLRLVERWQRRGFDLHFGVGIALGYATLGMVGFEGRQDYTAIGSVVNLAARLCSESKTGDILIDRKACLSLDPATTVDEVGARALKGFREPVPVFRIASSS